MNKNFFLILILFSNVISFSQPDTTRLFDKIIFQKKHIDSTSSISYKNKKVISLDLGFNTAPFSIKFKDSIENTDRLNYKNNSRLVLGVSFAYKWFSLRAAFNLPGHIKPTSKYGETNTFDLGVEFKTKRHYFDIDFRSYTGYAIKNSYKWSQNLNTNYILSNINTTNFSVNSWRFLNPNIKINYLRGKTGMYLKDESSIYIKTTFNIHNITNYLNTPIIPTEKQNNDNSKIKSQSFSTLDFGIFPGYVYVKRISNWQFSGMLGIGPVIQIKNYIASGQTRTFLGFAPRYDIGIIGGYNVKKYFVMLLTEFDNKSVKYFDLKISQNFYSIRLIGGIRI